jgi:hypothetical protein
MRFGSICLRVMVVLPSLAATALAHPGHGTTDPHTVSHYIAEPLHVAPLLVFVAAAVGLSLLAARRRSH